MLMKNDVSNNTQTSCAQIYFLSLRYLESCNIPVTVKRKYQFSSNTTSSNSDDDKKATEDCVQVSQENPGMICQAHILPVLVILLEHL